MAPAVLPRNATPAVQFYVRNLEASVQFYVNTLGFAVVAQADDHAIVALGRSIVRLADASRPDRGGRHGQLPTTGQKDLLVPDVDGMYNRVRNARVVVLDEVRDRASKVRGFVTIDPDGYPVRLAAGT